MLLNRRFPRNVPTNLEGRKRYRKATLSKVELPICSKTILVLDSDVQRRTQMRYTLSWDGYKVLEAANLEHAASICSVTEIPIDLVILEAAAEPSFNWPTCRPCAPQLLITGSESQAQKSPDDFWHLPFDPEQLLSEVSSALAESGQ